MPKGAVFTCVTGLGGGRIHFYGDDGPASARSIAVVSEGEQVPKCARYLGCFFAAAAIRHVFEIISESDWPKRDHLPTEVRDDG